MDILLADDDPDDRDVFYDAVKEIAPHMVCSFAKDGNEALEILQSSIVAPTHIFLDINMPQMNGLQCLTKLKQHDRLKDIPVTVYSTTADEKEIKVYRSLGAGFLQKTYTFEDLKQSLVRILAG